MGGAPDQALPRFRSAAVWLIGAPRVFHQLCHPSAKGAHHCPRTVVATRPVVALAAIIWVVGSLIAFMEAAAGATVRLHVVLTARVEGRLDPCG